MSRNELKDHLSTLDASDLMEKANYEEGDDGVSYEATWVLIGRWREGEDLQFLVDLLESGQSRDRSSGAYYLGEVGPVNGLKAAVTKLADDPLSACRRAFVEYVTYSDDYDEAIASGLASCLCDLHLGVRLEAIRWAARTSDERFEDFSKRVRSGAGSYVPRFPNPSSADFWNEAIARRSVRAIEIICCIRSGMPAAEIAANFPQEDSLIFESLVFREKRTERFAVSKTSAE